MYIFKRKVVLSNISIRVSGMFVTREVSNDDIKGFRVEDKAIFIYSNVEGVRRIMINDYRSIGDSDGLIRELSNRFSDLNAVETQKLLNNILSDNEIGYSQEERMTKLQKASKVTVIYNLLGLSFLIALFFINTLFGSLYFTFISLIYPVLGVILLFRHHGLIKFITKKTSPHPNVIYGMLFPVCMLFVKGIVSYNLVEVNRAYLPIALIALLFFGLIYWKGFDKTDGAAKGQIIGMLTFALFYALGFTLTVNCDLDQSRPQPFSAKVKDLNIEHGKKITYHIKLTPWGPISNSRDLQISKSQFDLASIGFDVKVCLKKGLLNIPWYYVDL
ncbi:hypothetical protein A0256_11305 [Mucilaginibacter sp. PAMC 26640]|nr:hypothetical protein A0256_11305 [Mucilaginibacter sp. PAMC 26640]